MYDDEGMKMDHWTEVIYDMAHLHSIKGEMI